MVRGKFDYLDLDVLDSPLMSSTPFTFLNGVPGSAIAENIFNDPHSWEDEGDTEDRALDSLAWLVEGIEKFKANSADVYGTFDLAVYDKRKTGLSSPAAGGKQLGSGLKGIDSASNVRPISISCLFEPTHDEDIQDQLSKILDAGGIPRHIRPLSSPLTPPPAHYPLKVNTSTVAGSSVDGPPPVVMHSSSITMSFLEWYGIYPESDLNLRSLSQHRKSIKSSIPPPGLEPPQSPALASSQPPPYSYTRSPDGSRPNSGSRSRSSSNSRPQSPTDTSVQRLSNCDSDDSNRPRRRRRLPSIPPEASPLPPLRSFSVLPTTDLPALASQPQEPYASSLRPLSSRSPLVGPAGPRKRANSRRGSEDSITRGAFLRPPVLRL